MAIKNIMVHLDQGRRTALRLKLAADLARQHGARLVGVFGQRGQAHQVGVVAQWPSAEYRDAAAACQQLFSEASAGLASEWVDINRGSDSELILHLTEQARYVDLAVFGQHEEGASYATPDLVEHVVLNSGRPLLVVPFAGEFEAVFDHPLIAWHDAREAARALNDALPLIAASRQVTVVTLAVDHASAQTPQAPLLTQLKLHGIAAEAKVVVPENDKVRLMDALLNSVTDEGATLLVMGAQEHSTLPFAAKGSGTRYVLEHMTVPVLMSH